MISSYPVRSAVRRSSQRPNSSWSSARAAFGIESYAASRIRRWRKRKDASAHRVRLVGTNQLLAHQRREVRRDRRPQRLGRELCDRPLVKRLPLDRSPLDDGAFHRVEPVEAGSEKRL